MYGNTLLGLKEGFENEKVTRAAKEIEILKKLGEEAANLAQLIEGQKNQRITRIADVKEDCKEETKMQTWYVKGFEKEATDKFAALRKHMENEIASRFTHQDEIINDLQKVIKSFQGTLKVFGKNV